VSARTDSSIAASTSMEISFFMLSYLIFLFGSLRSSIIHKPFGNVNAKNGFSAHWLTIFPIFEHFAHCTKCRAKKSK
ncbi:MAG: hypothetical protein IKW24_02650, partial [Clostridia bacterium]|nr:hypothetical protein [Clostridia bacterium]